MRHLEANSKSEEAKKQAAAHIIAARLRDTKLDRQAIHAYVKQTGQDMSLRERRKFRRQAQASLRLQRTDSVQPKQTLPDEQFSELQATREKLDAQDQAEFDAKKGHRGKWKRIGIVSKAIAPGVISGLSKAEKKQMRIDIGDDTIKVTGRKAAIAGIISGGLFLVSEGGRLGGSIENNLIPLAQHIPVNEATVLGTIGATIASYALTVETNRRLTDEIGISPSTVTLTQGLGERVLPRRSRDNFSRFIANSSYNIFRTAPAVAAVAPLGGSREIIAGSIAATATNLASSLGGEGFLFGRKVREKMKKRLASNN